MTRWALSGRLRIRRVGRRILTSRAAVAEMLETFNAPAATIPAVHEPREDVRQAGQEAAARIAGGEA